MTNHNIINDLFNCVPELKSKFEKSFEQHLITTKDGIYVIWGLGVMSCVLDLLKTPSVYSNQLQKIFNFFETMAQHEDERKDLLMYSTLETLDDHKELLNTAFSFMGSKTKKLLLDVQAFLGE